MLYRFIIELSNIDREVYETLDFRVSQHPSEIPSYLLTRTLAYSLSYQEGLSFSDEGLSNPDAPGLIKYGYINRLIYGLKLVMPQAVNCIKPQKLLVRCKFTLIKVPPF